MRLAISFQPRSIALAVLASLGIAGTAGAVPVIGLTATNALTMFDSASPANGSAPVVISGLEGSNQTILGIDLRPTNGLLYGISSDSKIYTLNATTGVATKVANLAPTSLNGVSFGVDFNPVADLNGAASLRITSNNGQNLAVNANSGAVTAQTGLTYNGSPIGATAAAYNNNDTDSSTGTTLYYIDTQSNALYNTGSPPGGVLALVGSLGIDPSGIAGFDIAGSGNQALAALSVDGSGNSGLYSINLANGAATSIGLFGVNGDTATAPQLLGLAINVAAVPEPATYALMLAGLAGVAFVAKRRRA